MKEIKINEQKKISKQIKHRKKRSSQTGILFFIIFTLLLSPITIKIIEKNKQKKEHEVLLKQIRESEQELEKIYRKNEKIYQENMQELQEYARKMKQQKDKTSKQQTKTNQTKPRLYKWKDKEGKIHYSNVSYPTKEYYKPMAPPGEIKY